jgi:hypothetical protein
MEIILMMMKMINIAHIALNEEYCVAELYIGI